MSKRIRIIEVGARDGLQNEPVTLSLAKRFRFIERLAKAGLKNIEVGAFVSPKWVPQMSGTGKLAQQVIGQQKKGSLPSDVTLSALVPNLKGMELALQTDLKEVAVFGACSESFSKKNINCSIEESFQRFDQVIQLAKKNKIKVRGYLSTAFACPYEGPTPPQRVAKLARRLLDLGVYEVSIGDTIGVATPRSVKKLLHLTERSMNLKKVAMHFHDTRGSAIANVYASLELGIRSFDSSLGGLGGCPYAKGASGNLATEDLVYMLEGEGIPTGIDVDQLVRLMGWMQKQIGRPLPSHVGRAGLPFWMK